MLLDLLMHVRLAAADLPVARLLRRIDQHLLVMDELDARVSRISPADHSPPRDPSPPTLPVSLRSSQNSQPAQDRF